MKLGDNSLGSSPTLIERRVGVAGATIAEGLMLGNYRIVRLLGAGGMGAVYLAEHVLLNTRHALKTIRPEFSMQQNFAERFQREAKLAMRLKHPHIVACTETGVAEYIPYLVMDYIEGPHDEPLNLRQLLDQRRERGELLDEDEAAAVGLEICKALDYAHSFRDNEIPNGIIHRDLKPANILLDKNTKLYIADFGLARLLGEKFEESVVRAHALSQSLGEQATLGKQVSISSDTVGTLDYMSPEQREGRVADVQSDVYAMGVILYELLTGRKVVGVPAPPSKVRPELNPLWDNIILERALAYEPEERYTTAGDFCHAIESVSLQLRPVVTERTKRHEAINQAKPREIGAPSALLVKSDSDKAEPSTKATYRPFLILTAFLLLTLGCVSWLYLYLRSTRPESKTREQAGSEPISLAPIHSSMHMTNSTPATDLVAKTAGLTASVMAETNKDLRQIPLPETATNFFQGAYALRSPENRKLALVKYAGAHASAAEIAVGKALNWLKGNQKPDGSWTISNNAVAGTGLALLAFLAHGETSASPVYGNTVEKGLNWLRSQQISDGNFQSKVEPYTHGIATFAMCEAYGVTRAPELKAVMDKAVQMIVEGQQKETGGWDYHYAKDSRRDTSVGAWQIQALKSALNAGCTVPGIKEALDNSSRDLKKVFDSTTGKFGYTKAGSGSLGMTAAAVFSLQQIGHCGDTETRSGLRVLREHEQLRNIVGNEAWPLYALYYITHANFHAGESAFASWNDIFVPLYVQQQYPDGSWPSFGASPSEKQCGAVYCTTLAVLTLGVYYRYPPDYLLEPAPSPPSTQPALLPDKVRQHTDPQASQKWTNSLGMIFVPVPGTEVLFSIWDTRVQDFQVFEQATGYAWPKPPYEQGPTHPVACMCWKTSKAFCAWLTEKERREGRIGPQQFYRLPMDLEWSTAVGLHDELGNTPAERSRKIKNIYPWGTTWPPPRGIGNFGKKLRVDDFEKTSPVGSFPPNQFGLYDMAGNLVQWCEDFFDETHEQFVQRGSSWKNTDEDHLMSSRRSSWGATFRDQGFGFRCVLVVR